jgi:hypothetical protein
VVVTIREGGAEVCATLATTENNKLRTSDFFIIVKPEIPRRIKPPRNDKRVRLDATSEWQGGKPKPLCLSNQQSKINNRKFLSMRTAESHDHAQEKDRRVLAAAWSYIYPS